MEIKLLEDFLCLARRRSFTKAANERAVTQPAFSRRIRSLEYWLGVDLIDRNAYPITLTTEGVIFRDVAEDVLHQLYEVRDEFRNEIMAKDATVRIAALHTLAITHFPVLYQYLKTQLAQINVQLRTLDLGEGIDSLKSHDSDFFLTYGHQKVPILLDVERFPYLSLAQEILLPVCKASRDGQPLHPWPATSSTPAQILTYTSNSFLGKVTKDLWGKKEMNYLPHKFIYENAMAHALKAMVLEGHGLAWLPLSSIRKEIEAGLLVVAAGPEWGVSLDIRFYHFHQYRMQILKHIWERTKEGSNDSTLFTPLSYYWDSPAKTMAKESSII